MSGTVAAPMPHELQRYIAKEQSDAASANQADHKPTYQKELDGITASAQAEYDAGLELIAEIKAQDPEDLSRCAHLYDHRQRGGAWDLVSGVVLGRRVLVPRYVTLIEEVRKLRELLA